MSAIPAYLIRARSAVETEGTETADRPSGTPGSPTDVNPLREPVYEIRNKSVAPPAPNSLLADVLALAQARVVPHVTLDGQMISDADGWLTLAWSALAAPLLVLRTVLLAAQRRDGPPPTLALELPR